MEPSTQKTATAYHEAGHAAVAILLGRSLKRVTIRADSRENSLGHVLYFRLPDWFSPEWIGGSDPAGHAVLDQCICTCLGGALAEEIFTGTYNKIGAANDEKGLADLLCYLGVAWKRDAGGEPYQDIGPARSRYRRRVKANLRRYWSAVEALAAALVRCKTISGERAQEITLAALPVALRAGTVKRIRRVGLLLNAEAEQYQNQGRRGGRPKKEG